MRSPRTFLAAFALITIAGVVADCAGRVVRYPDRSTPLRAYETFVTAWRTGDLEVLAQSYSPSRLKILVEGEKIMGSEALSEWYRRNADRIQFGRAVSEDLGGVYALVKVPIEIDRPGRREAVLYFDFVPDREEWRIWRIRTPPVMK
ncbi:MAG: hypothetical protein O6952_00650 [Planctomycetota bacterium]|nr:hypothetical protein [Planctomycetota bacterium]